jgi:endonuclease III related protein
MMSDRSGLIRLVYDRLLAFFGPQDWWPAETPFEVIVGAILTQNTAWKNVARAIGNLREHGLLSFEALCAVPEPSLAELVRPSGYYNQKARKLKGFCQHVTDTWQGDLDGFLALETDTLRHELLRIRGVGPETADSIVLYAAHKPSFVVDTYTYRIFSRHGWVSDSPSYDELRGFFMDCLEPDVGFFQELHALLVRTGHLFCRKTPLCGGCPLNGLGPGMT